MPTGSYTVQLPAGTNKDVVLNIGFPGGWPGAMYFHLASGASFTVSRVDFIRPSPDPKPRTRSGTSASGQAVPFTVAALFRQGWFLRQGECVINLRYTSTQDISMCVEANSGVAPTANP